MMQFYLILFSTLTIFSIFGAPSDYKRLKDKLESISEQLSRVEVQLNNSISQLLDKIDDNTVDIISSIASARISQRDGLSENSVRPVTALLIIDVQNDFIDGTLALRNCPSKHNGEEVVPVINRLLDSINFDVVVYTHDWHPSDHISFFDNLSLRSHLLANDSIPLENLRLYSTATFAINNLTHMEQTLWPRHCVQNSSGAKLHPDLKVIEPNSLAENISVIHIQKGTKPDIDSYSAFWDNFKLTETKLNEQLKERNVTKVFVTGLATDWCVQSTAVHAVEYGYQTFIVEDACRGVDEKTIKERLRDFKRKKGYVIQSNEVKDYV